MITVTMITKNEEAAVGKVIKDIRRVAPEAEILVVDSSSDKTAEIAGELGARVVKQFPPQGYGPAMVRALTEANGDIVITLDCDDTYPVEAIPTLVSQMEAGGYDLIDASRLKRKPAAMPWINYLANWGFAWLASILFFRRVTDLHSGMRAYRRNLIHEFAWRAKGAALPVELLLIPIARGKKVGTIFIDYHERIGSTTLDPLPSAWWTLKRIFMCRFGKL